MSDFHSNKEEKEKEPSPALQNLQSLIVNTLENGGIISDDIEFREEPGAGVGVFASAPASKGSTLISIPYQLCMSVNSVTQYSKLSKIFRENPGLLDYPDEVLALGLMYAFTTEDEECPWKNHVKTLPKSFNTTLFWSEEDMNELKGHNVFYLTGMLNQRIASDFESIHQPLIYENPTVLKDIDSDIYAWALSVVYSRSLDITRNEKSERIIVPVLDMLNHSPFVAAHANETFQYDEENDLVNYSCSVELQPGDQCFAVYGHYPNAKLLFTYGFVIQNNPIRAIDLWTRITPTCSNYEIKQKLLQESELTREQTYDFSGTIRPNFVSDRLLATIRVIQAEPSEMQNIRNAFKGKMISVRNELATYTSLKNLVKLRLKPDIAEAERKELGSMLLNNTPVDNRKLMALIVKVEERELLQETIGLIDSWTEELTRLGENYKCPDNN